MNRFLASKNQEVGEPRQIAVGIPLGDGYTIPRHEIFKFPWRTFRVGAHATVPGRLELPHRADGARFPLRGFALRPSACQCRHRIAGGRHPAELGSESAARDESGRGTSGHCREWVVRCKTEAFFGNWPQKSAKNPARPPKLKMGKPGPFNWGGDSLSPQSPPTASASWKPEPRRPAISVES